ncbi:glycosyltransferase [Prevotella sp. PINT]|jgi:Predicted glycosyltransferases|uniref:glycosyltransferase family 2 protein n=1 Tax=Palleniella intestinalis TaxID=2736291 RepID=UPI001556DB17|nr:glycosyltransferase [Palleniella intestinalis]NPD81695.1 glycosyltransferase [Palleniella intestinalis]
MIKALSILIPAYNTVCTDIVKALQQQAERIGSLSYEIIVAEDGSTDKTAIERNDSIRALPHCRHIIRKDNVGRAAIRNFLAANATHEWLLFVDCGLSSESEDYLEKYVLTATPAPVIYGGCAVHADTNLTSSNLRYRYEKGSLDAHHAEMRQTRPYRNFRTCNFLVRKDIMEKIPFDERFRSYGYEDIEWGKRLRQEGIRISHIDNVMLYNTLEKNEHFLQKTEEAMRTLHAFHNDLTGYSKLLGYYSKLQTLHITPCVTAAFSVLRPLMRHNLCGKNPSLLLFQMYKLGYFSSLMKGKIQ